MKISIIALLAFVCLLQAVRAYPVEEIEAEGTRESIQPDAEHIRVKRVTCDVLSFEAKGIKVNDAACATHCLVRGRRGGYCNGQKVCVCR